MSRSSHLGALLVLALGFSAFAQKNSGRAAQNPRAQMQRPGVAGIAQKPAPMKKAPPAPREGIRGSIGTPLDRWNQMTPEQRERALSKLPPERQQQIRERLEKFNSLPPEEQDRLRRRYELFSSLPAARQQLVRKQIQNFSQLPPDRRRVISREFEQLRRLPDDERQARLDSDEFRSKYNPEERNILRDLSENLTLPPSARTQK